MPTGRQNVDSTAATLIGPRIVLLLAALLAGLAPSLARAQIGSERYSSIVLEARSGRVLSAVNPDEQRYPASLTKMMTLYMVFEALRDRRITLQQYVPVSASAASMSPTKLGLVPGTRITVHEAILGLVIKSANDAAAALGEMLGGGEARFARMMTLRARALGMSRTTFQNASGLPDPDQWTTARDMATLGRRLVQDFPDEYRYFSAPSFRFHGRTILTHDHMLETYPGADGIKTGYTDASGFNLVTSAVRHGVRLVGVVMGAARAPERDIHMAALLDQAYDRLDIGPSPPAARVRVAGGGLIAAAQAAPAPVAAGRGRPPRFAVQVGAFMTEAVARRAATMARRAAGAGDPRAEHATVQGRTVWRAQLVGLTEAEARAACAALARQRLACTPIRPDPRQLAGR
jgi:D-alanyl-D-alanine carboxypeptidase